MNTLDLSHPHSRSALRITQLLVGCYAAISVLTLVAIILLRNTAAVNDVAWTRGTVIAAVSLLTVAFAARMARGSARAYLRLRIATALQVVAIVVIAALPGFLPGWMRIEQIGCGLILVAVVVVANGRQLRSSFAAR